MKCKDLSKQFWMSLYDTKYLILIFIYIFLFTRFCLITKLLEFIYRSAFSNQN